MYICFMNLGAYFHRKLFLNKTACRLWAIIGMTSCFMMTACTNESKPDLIQKQVDSMYFDNPDMHGFLVNITDTSSSKTYAVGWADSVNAVALKEETPILLASVTKLYMMAAFMRLTEIYPVTDRDTVSRFISAETDSLLRADGYRMDKIFIIHLLMNCSGLADYSATSAYQEMAKNHPEHQWTRAEQLQLAITEADPQFYPGESFVHSELNYLLLGEILEHFTGMPYYKAVRHLLELEKHGLTHTWWNSLEEVPNDLPPLALQFASQYDVNSKTLHPSFDLYGGGGLVATASDLGRFTQMLYEGEFFKNSSTLKSLFSLEIYYPSYTIAGMVWTTVKGKAYGYGGFWGVSVLYFPESEKAIVVAPMERSYWKTAQDFAWKLAME